ncbi:hypothetical protein [Weissella paramesenteroides]|uniref:Uncharacterized protein n=1 Tax=Weissella paramesenteroides ATCC 33313 TaxID=585506 RepID=C5R823_WEIPA|nr:hypothetical protein [Weissella paramesenteroides]EER75607.1 hypothetical protein HMPREF0877_0118 [Weissella paramesenteroides ATCC 33313]
MRNETLDIELGFGVAKIETLATVPNDYLNKLIQLEDVIQGFIDNDEGISASELKETVKEIGL